jgi:teichuronic acid exporter
MPNGATSQPAGNNKSDRKAKESTIENTAEIADPDASQYLQHARRAVVWNTAFNLFRDLLQFVQMVILTRLLDNEAYGMFAFATSVIGFIAVFSATPFLSYTLQVKSENDVHYHDHFTAGAVIQFAMFLIANLAALLIASIPTYSLAAPLVHVLSLTFLLEWTCEIRRMMIQREFDFRSLRLLQSIGLLAGILTAFVMGYSGCGAYTLVVPGMLATVPFIWDLFVRQQWRPNWRFSWTNYSPAFQYGITRIGSGTTLTGRQLIETSVLTAVIGFGPLGIYNRAVGLANLACVKTASQLMAAIYPILTRLEIQSGQAARAGNVALRLVVWSVIPTATALAILAAPIVNAIYGPQWSGVIPLLKWTLILSVTSAIAHVKYQLVLARNKPRICLICDIHLLLGSILGLSLALPYGVVWYLITLQIVNCLNTTLLTHCLIKEQAISVSGLCNAFGPAFICTVIAFFLSSRCVETTSQVSNCIAWPLCFSVTYAGGLRILFPRALGELINLFPKESKIGKYLFL